MRARVLLGAAVALLAAAIWLWRRSAAEPERDDHARPTEPVLATSAPSAEPVRPTLPAPPGEPQRPPPTPSEQRDATGASAEPTFKQETLRAIREAAAPQLRHCVDDSFARAPERQQTDIQHLLSAVITISVTRGQVTVRDARVSINRFHDDELVHCAEGVYNQLRVLVPVTQGDGEGVVETGFEVK